MSYVDRIGVGKQSEFVFFGDGWRRDRSVEVVNRIERAIPGFAEFVRTLADCRDVWLMWRCQS